MLWMSAFMTEVNSECSHLKQTLFKCQKENIFIKKMFVCWCEICLHYNTYLYDLILSVGLSCL